MSYSPLFGDSPIMLLSLEQAANALDSQVNAESFFWQSNNHYQPSQRLEPATHSTEIMKALSKPGVHC